jgi:hypothetical protein
MVDVVTSWVSVVISCLALAVSGLTAWLTFFRRGALRMTQPTVVYFGPDGGPERGGKAKVYLRTLLYSTSRSGQMIESMHVGIQRGETRQNFSVWVHGDDRLSRGSGLFVGHEGVALNHHFLLPRDGADFQFLPGEYWVRIYAKRVDQPQSQELTAVRLVVTDAHAAGLQDEDAGLYFDWGPDQRAYHPHIRKQPRIILPKDLFEAAE